MANGGSIREVIRMVKDESIQRVIHDSPDSIEIGTPSKGGAVKIYGNFEDVESFKKKIDNAKEVKKYAEANIMVNV